MITYENVVFDRIIESLNTLLADGDITNALDEAKLFGLLHAKAVTQPEVKKYVEDNL